MTNPKRAYYEGNNAVPSLALKVSSAIGITSLVAVSIAIWIIKIF